MVAAPSREGALDLCAGAVVLRDPTRRMEIGEVAAAAPSRFGPLACPSSLGVTSDATWVRFTLPTGGPRLFAFLFPLVEELDLYLPDRRGQFQRLAGGLARPGGEFDFRAWAHVAELPPDGGTAFLRVITRAPVLIDFGAFEHGRLASLERIRFLVYGLDVAGLLGFAAVTLMRLLRRRDSASLMIGAIGVSLGAFVLFFFGFGPWLLPLSASAAVALPYFFGGASVSLSLLGARRYLDLKRRQPRTVPLFTAAGVVPGVAGILSAAWPGSLGWLAPVACIVSPAGWIALMAVHRLWGSDFVAWIYSFALSMVLVGTMLFASEWLGISPLSGGTWSGAHLIFWIGILAIADAIRVSADSRSRRRRDDLERQVALSEEELQGARERQKRSERDRARLEEQLRQSQRLESIGRLAGGVAHDFNNLLTVVSANLTLIEQAVPEGSEEKSLAAEARDAVRRGAKLTGQLLAFGRRQAMEPRPLDLFTHLSDMRPVLARLLGEDVELALDLEREGTVVRADPAQIEQVVLNLIANARDALPRGGRVAVTLVRSAAADGRPVVVLEVQDDGPGIPDEARDHIFEPFFTTKPEGQGTGLGLATVYGIVKQHGGFIEVDSVVGKGTRFRVHLPTADAPAEAADVPVAESATAASGSETILLVEDEAAVRQATVRLLERLGYHVLAAESAPVALDVVCAGGVDLMITDVVMPGMDGLELAKRAQAVRPDLRVLLISGYSHDALARRGAIADRLSILRKPFTLEELGLRLRRELESRNPVVSQKGGGGA